MTTVTVKGYMGSAYYLQAPVTELIVGESGHIASDGEYGIVSPMGGAGRYTVINGGGVESAGEAVYLRDGGLIRNGSTHREDALIEGVYGVVINHGPGTVENFATVMSAGATKVATAVVLGGGGTLINGSGADTSALLDGYGSGVTVGDAPGTLDNFGVITATGTDVGVATGVLLAGGGGRITNGSAGDTDALISGIVGVQVNYVGASLTNFGTIDGVGGVLSDLAPVSVTNLGVIEGASGGVPRPDGVTYVGFGLLTDGGGLLVNGSRGVESALVEGADGIQSGDSPMTIVNFATIEGQSADGVLAYQALKVTNGSGSDDAAWIWGAGDAVFDRGASGTVVNQGHIVGAGMSATNAGVFLADGGLVVNDASGFVQGSNGVLVEGAAGTLRSLGQVFVGGAQYAAVQMDDGGSVTNGSAADTTALLFGGDYGVLFKDAAGTVANFASITAAGRTGVVLEDGGRVINGASDDTVAVIGYVKASGASTIVDNFATIQGIYLQAGGSVGNAAAATVDFSGVDIAGAAGTVTNSGVIDGESYSAGVQLRAGGRVTNGSTSAAGALIEGVVGITIGQRSAAASGTVVNYGAIDGGKAGASYAVYDYGDAIITNGSASDTTASMYGLQAGIDTTGGTVTNFGEIAGGGSGTAYEGVFMRGGGSVINGPRAVTSALISGWQAVVADGLEAVVSNFATIEGAYSGVSGDAAMTIVNGAASDTAALIEGRSFGLSLSGSASITNFGTVTGNVGIFTQALSTDHFSLVNGSAADTSATVSGILAGVLVNTAAGTVRNDGAITGGSSRYGVYAGVCLEQGGAVTNGAADDTTALIQGGDGILVKGQPGTIMNFGTVSGGSYPGAVGVSLAVGGTLTNHGVIDGGSSPTAVGVSITDGTLTNYGTIESAGYAVEFQAAGFLIVEQGSEFVGKVSGADGATLELAARAGTISSLVGGEVVLGGAGPAQTFSDFASLEIARGAIVTLTGTGTIGAGGGVTTLFLDGDLYVTGSLVIAGPDEDGGRLFIEGGVVSLIMTSPRDVTFKGAGELRLADSRDYGGAISGFTRSGTTSLDLEDIAFGTGTKATYSGTTTGGVLTVTDGTHTAAITMKGDYLSSTFTLASDGGGGTIVTDPPTRAPALASAMAGFAPSPAAVGPANSSSDAQAPVRLAPPAGS